MSACTGGLRSLLATVMIIAVAAAGAGRSGASAGAQSVGTSGPAAVEGTAWGLSGPRGIMPAQPRMVAAPVSERSLRVKLPTLIGAIAAALLAAVVVSRSRLLRHQSSRLPLVLRGWSLRRRAPPLLLG